MRDLVQARQLLRTEADQQAHRCKRQRQRQEAPRHTEREALEEDGPNQPSAALSQGGPNRHLPVTGLGPHEEQVGDVGARDEQQEPHGAQQDPQHRLDVAHHHLAGQVDLRPESGTRQNRRGGLVRKDLGQVRQHRVQLGLRLTQRRLVGEARHAVDPEGPELHVVPVEPDRPPQLHLLLREREPGRHHTDHFDARPVEIDDAPNHARIGAEPGTPQAVAQHGHRRGARPVFLGGERTAEAGRCPHHVEERRGNARRRHALRILRTREARLLVAVHRHALERPALLRVQEVERVRHRQLVELRKRRRGVTEDHEPFGIRERQRAQQHRVDDREDGDVGADPNRQHGQRDEREAEVRDGAAAEEAKLRGKRHANTDSSI